MPFNPGLRRRICERLGQFEVRTLSRDQLHAAAVALVLAPDPQSGEACFLLTRRPSKMRRHGGQFALPGGRVDAGEQEVDAALRELHEELGIKLGPADVLGTLDDFATRSGFRIRPFVLWTESLATLAPDPVEVDSCFCVPLGDLAAAHIPTTTPIPESEQPVLSVHLDSLDQEIFAPTAALLYQFREIALVGRTTRVSHFEQPMFAWR